MSGAPSRRLRLFALGALLLAQAAQLWVFFPTEPKVEADNTRYEEAGFHLASGRGLSLSYATLPDEDVRAWACTRHPDRCAEGDLYPSAGYPPGYQFYIGLVYLFAGRNVMVLLITQCLLHLLLMLMFEHLASKQLMKPGYLFAIGVGITYPFLARQANLVMSDHLHAVLLFASIWSFFTIQRVGLRAGISGLLFSLATLTRPYSVVALPLLMLVPKVRRAIAPSRSALALFLLGILLPFAIWIGRNAEMYGRLIPFTTTGIGAGLYLNKTEWTIGSSLEGDNATRIYAELEAVAGNITTWRGDRKLREAAVEWMLENPHLVLAALPKRVVRVWISMGYQGQGFHPMALGLAAYLGSLLLLGVAGMWRRRHGRWLFPLVITLTYWAFLLHTPAEARRSLALRLPMLLFAAAAVDDLAARRRKRGGLETSVDDELGPSTRGIEGAPNVLADQPK